MAFRVDQTAQGIRGMHPKIVVQAKTCKIDLNMKLVPEGSKSVLQRLYVKQTV